MLFRSLKSQANKNSCHSTDLKILNLNPTYSIPRYDEHLALRRFGPMSIGMVPSWPPIKAFLYYCNYVYDNVHL